MSNIIIPQYKNPNKNNDKPFFRYNGFSISMSPNEKYPKMVEISKGPKSASKILGKKYVNEFYAIKAIDEYKTYKMINSQLASAIHTLESEGFDVDLILESIDEN